MDTKNKQDSDKEKTADSEKPNADLPKQKEIGGRKGLDPVRYGDWEVNGKAVDF